MITDAWQGSARIDKHGYLHEPRNQRAARLRGDDRYQLLPGVHRIASLAKRWLLGTHQGSVGDGHLQSYLNEFAFRFNRRGSRSRGLVFYRVLQLAVAPPPRALQRPRRRPPSQDDPAGRADDARTPTNPRPPTRGAPLANERRFRTGQIR